jgi:multicomponent Na+:H+ antiporter subunit G
MEAPIEIARLLLSGVLVAAGLALMLGGAIGLLRFPDLYTRVHAANTGDVVGSIVLLAGLVVVAPDAGAALRLLLLAALIAAVGPVLLELVAHTAHAAGLAPIAGRYVAPRPGAPRSGDLS